MSGKEFFTERYRKLGWEFRNPHAKQAIRANRMNTEEARLIRRLEALNIKLEKIQFLENGYWIIETEFSLGATSEYLLGLFSIQEAAAQIPPTLFTDLEEKTVLDACAAPGGKTIQLADQMQNTGSIFALDIKKSRLIALSNQLERCHVANTIVCSLDARKASSLGRGFDRILLDVPCSGNFATDKQWFNRRTINDVERNAALQREILTEAVSVMKEDGEIVYSTCSLEPEEDELNIDWAIRNLKLRVEEIDCHGERGLVEVFGKSLNCSIENSRRIWPAETQGFFVCKLVKRAF